MVSVWKRFSDIFWTESVWLSPGFKWTDVANGPHKKILYPDTKDFLYQLILTVVLLLVRHALGKFCFEPLGRALGTKHKKRRTVQAIPVLESAYRKSPQLKDAYALAKQLDISERAVERWWRLRRNSDKPTDIVKFCEHAWRVVFFSFNFLFGMYIMWDKDYFWDLEKCWMGYPHQGVTNDVWWFYTLYIAYSWSSVITLFSEVRRSDFMPTLVHHVLTSLLLCTSWICSIYRIGAVMVPFFDVSEVFLEIAKASKLTKYDKLAQYFLLIFAFLWFYGRMYIYPFQILNSTFHGQKIVPPSYMFYVIFTMLIIILALQIYWSVLILIVVYNLYRIGDMHDIRSSESECSDTQRLVEKVTNDVICNDLNGHSVTQPKRNRPKITKGNI